MYRLMIWTVLVSACVLSSLEETGEVGESAAAGLTRAYLCGEELEGCEEKLLVYGALVEELYPAVCPNWKPALTYLVYSVGYTAAAEDLGALQELVNGQTKSAVLPYLSRVCADLKSEVCLQLQQAFSLPCY